MGTICKWNLYFLIIHSFTLSTFYILPLHHIPSNHSNDLGNHNFFFIFCRSNANKDYPLAIDIPFSSIGHAEKVGVQRIFVENELLFFVDYNKIGELILENLWIYNYFHFFQVKRQQGLSFSHWYSFGFRKSCWKSWWPKNICWKCLRSWNILQRYTQVWIFR